MESLNRKFMPNKLYIRFFRNKKENVPVNSNLVCLRNEDMAAFINLEISESIITWMEAYPNGKTDFVWLN